MKRLVLTLSLLVLLSVAPLQSGGDHGDWCACGMHASQPISFEIDHTLAVWQGTAGTSLNRWDQYSDVFSWAIGNGAGGSNGTNEIIFFGADVVQSQYGIAIDSNTFGVTYIDPSSAFGTFDACPAPGGTTCGFFSETDVIMNAEFNRGWTSGAPNYDDTGPANYVATAIHELGHALGLHHNFDSLTTMNYYEDFAAIYLTLSDANAARGYYPARARTTTDIATYPFRYDGFKYGGTTVASVSPTSVDAGDPIEIRNFTIENIGSVSPSDVRVRLYLSSDATISTADHELGSIAFTSLSTWWDTTGTTFTVPASTPGGVYYVGAIAYYNLTTVDSITYNNSWVLDAGRRVTVTEVCVDDGFDSFGSGDDTCPGAGIAVGATQSRDHCDEDWARFQAYQGVTYEILTSNLAGGADTTLTLYESCGPQLAFDDDGGSGFASRIVWTPAADAVLDIRIREYQDSYQPGEGYDLSVNCIANCGGIDPYEPNTSVATATSIQCPSFQTVDTLILPTGDLDVFELSGPVGSTVTIDIDADEIGSPLDPLLVLMNSGGSILDVSDDGPAPGEPFTLDSYLVGTIPGNGRLYAGVTAYPDFDFNGSGGSVGTYTMTVSCSCVRAGEVYVVWPSKQTMTWSAISPSSQYDVLRSRNVQDFVTGTSCLETDDTDTQMNDFGQPLPAQLFSYLVRAEYNCPTGAGSLGFRWPGVPRTGRSCGGP